MATASALIVVVNAAHDGKALELPKTQRLRMIGKRGEGYKRGCCSECNTVKKSGCYKFALSSHLQRGEAHNFYESLVFSKQAFSFRLAWAT
jgi:hypothetical protein